MAKLAFLLLAMMATFAFVEVSGRTITPLEKGDQKRLKEYRCIDIQIGRGKYETICGDAGDYDDFWLTTSNKGDQTRLRYPNCIDIYAGGGKYIRFCGAHSESDDSIDALRSRFLCAKQKLNHCQMALVNPEEQYLNLCCNQLQQVEEKCQLKAIAHTLEEAQKQQGEQENMEHMLSKFQMLPNLCNLNKKWSVYIPAASSISTV